MAVGNTFKITKNVDSYFYGRGSLSCLADIVSKRRSSKGGGAVYFVDHYFKEKELINSLCLQQQDALFFADTTEEPTTEYVDSLTQQIMQRDVPVATVVGIGGGSTLDIAKAVSNLLANGGKSEDYQGWDLLKVPGVFKIGIPTLSGTGAESSRTCVLINRAKNLKLGMNSEFTVYDQLILDSDLTRTVPRGQYFYSGMDTYIHCIESLTGRHRHPVSDAYSKEALRLCEEIFTEGDMTSDANREKLMVASFLGGAAIANSYVGVVHPFSAGLSMVLGTHHCLANCLVLNVLAEFYADAASTFKEMLKRQEIELPTNVTSALNEKEFQNLYDATIIHEKPLTNALGNDFKKILTRDRVIEIFRKI